MTRLPDWPARLAAFLEERRAAPFAWGTNDCCLFAADAVLAITGLDLAAKWRGSYLNAAGALKALKDGGGMIKILASVLPAADLLRNVRQAQRGDVVLLPSRRDGMRIACGVVDLSGRAASPGERGIATLPLRAAIIGWRV